MSEINIMFIRRGGSMRKSIVSIPHYVKSLVEELRLNIRKHF